jgi:hypothetical protein
MKGKGKDGKKKEKKTKNTLCNGFSLWYEEKN